MSTVTDTDSELDDLEEEEVILLSFCVGENRGIVVGALLGYVLSSPDALSRANSQTSFRKCV